MKLLCVDTATAIESIALIDGHVVLTERAVRRTKGHGPGVLDDIDEALAGIGWKLADLDGFACGLGPGSFTGLRIALATLKGLALALDRPLFGARTTDLLCAALPGRRAVAVLDARRGQIYAHGGGIERPVCCDPEALATHLPAGPPPVLLGDGALAFADRLRAAVPEADIPTARALHLPRAALLPACVDLSAPAALATIEPVYVRKSDAEINYPDGFPDALARART